MKKLLAFILAIFMLSIPNYAYSSDGIYFDLEYSGDKIQLNRGFNIYFNAKSNITCNISALRLDIHYDSSQLKFLSTESTAYIDTYEPESGTVRIVWLNSDGQAISSQAEKLFTIRFKPLNSTDNFSYDFSTKILEAVSSNVEYLTVENSPSITITKNQTIINSSEDISSKSEKSKAESSKTKNSSKSENESNSKAEDNTEETEANESEISTDISIGNRKSINSENGFTYFILGAGGMLLLVAIVFLAYIFGKKMGKNKKQ